ncbi:hypothetical protein HC766_07765 [Candidatus Gracilibacteria bacterium]|nr:hypothetical protein [Candidatus Gracilibacteria bacterium]
MMQTVMSVAVTEIVAKTIYTGYTLNPLHYTSAKPVNIGNSVAYLIGTAV